MPERTVAYRFTGNFANLAAGLGAMGKGVSDLGMKLTALDKNGVKMRAGLTQIGSTAGKVGLIAAAGFAIAVGAAAKFEQAMSSVQAATHETAGNMELLRTAAIKAGAATKFSATEAANAIEELAKAGISTTDILSGGLDGALSLAAAGNLEVADAAQIAATALTQFKLTGEDVPHVADLLAAGAGKAQGEVSDLSMALKQSGLVASQMGVSIEETTGTLAAFASAGLLGSDAGTSFRTMLLRLANPTKQSAELMAQLGIQAYDAQGKFVGVASVAEQLKTAFEGKTQAERDSALATIFGSDAIRAANVLYADGAKGIDEWTTKVDDQGYAAETAAIKMDNLAGDLEQFKGSLETALIGAGTGSQGPLRQLVEGATDLVNAFNKLPAPAQNAATGMLAITAVLGGGLWFTAKVVNGVASMKLALANLGTTGTRAAAALRAVGLAAGAALALELLGGAVTSLEQKMDKALPSTEALTQSILDLGSANAAQDLAEQVGSLASAMDTLNSSGIEGFSDHLNELANSGGVAGNALKGLSLAFAPGLVDSQAQRELREAAASINATDAALANIVSTGSPEQAEAALKAVAAAQGLTADQTAQLTGMLPQYKDALASAANQTTLTAGATKDAVGATDRYGVAARQAAQGSLVEADAIRDATKAMQDKTSATLAAFDAETGYRQALKAAEAQGKKNNAGIKGDTEAALNNRSAISALAGAWNNQSDSVKNNVDRYKQARKSFIDTAAAMGVPKKAAEDLAQRLLEIPKSVVTRIEAKSDPAIAAALRLKRAIESIPREWRTNYIINTTRSITTQSMAGGRDGDPATPQADGGSVPKDGGPYADRHLYMLAPGEEIISNRHGQADAFRRDRAAGAIPGYANGGTIGGAFSSAYAHVGAGGTPMFELTSAAGIAADALSNLAGLGKKELEIRTKLLQKEVDRDKQRADALKQEWDSIRSAVADRFRSDPFAQSSGSLVSIGGPEGGPTTAAQSLQWALAQQQVDAAQSQGQSPADILKQDIADAKEMRRLLRQAAKAGIHGNALSTLAQGADADQIRALLADPRLAKQYDNLYDTRQQVTGSLGRDTANAVLGKQLAHANAIAAASNQALREANKRLHHLEQLAEKNPKDTGDHVAKASNGASAAGNRRRVVGQW